MGRGEGGILVLEVVILVIVEWQSDRQGLALILDVSIGCDW